MEVKNIIFAHSRYEYGSYTDYKKLVELAGFETCYVDQIDYARTDVVYIVSPVTGELRPHRDGSRDKPYYARVIHWCLERPGGAGGIADFINGTKAFLNDHYADFVWLSDRGLCEQVADSRCQFVILGSHPDLGQPGYKYRERCYDVVHLSYATPRRSAIWARLTDKKIRIADNAWGSERDNALRRSKFMVNVHQDDWPVIEPLRFALCAAYGLPMITEEIRNAYPYTRQGPGHYCVQATYHDLAEKVCQALEADYAPYLAMGTRMREAMTTEFEFGRQVRLAVKDLPDAPLDMVIR